MVQFSYKLDNVEEIEDAGGNEGERMHDDDLLLDD